MSRLALKRSLPSAREYLALQTACAASNRLMLFRALNLPLKRYLGIVREVSSSWFPRPESGR